jgi:DNA-binding NtrC family response regulator
MERAAILAYTFARWQQLPRLLRAQLALTLKRAGREADARLLLASILDATKTEPDFETYFPPEDHEWLWYSDTIESHAFILRALLEIDPHNAKNPISEAGSAAAEVEVRAKLVTPTMQQLELLMTEHGGVIQLVADTLGCSRRQVGRWLEQYGIDRQRFRLNTP